MGFDERYEMQHTSQLTPMDHLIDAVRPDPPSRHGMQMLVQEYLANQTQTLGRSWRRCLSGWIAAGPEGAGADGGGPAAA